MVNKEGLSWPSSFALSKKKTSEPGDSKSVHLLASITFALISTNIECLLRTGNQHGFLVGINSHFMYSVTA